MPVNFVDSNSDVLIQDLDTEPRERSYKIYTVDYPDIFKSQLKFDKLMKRFYPIFFPGKCKKIIENE